MPDPLGPNFFRGLMVALVLAAIVYGYVVLLIFGF